MPRSSNCNASTMRKTWNVGNYIYVAVLILIMGVPTVLATTLIGIRVTDGFVIAVDSKVVYRGTGIRGPAATCKIFQSGPLYFSFTGLANDRNRNFFPEKIIATHFSAPESFALNMEKIERAVSDSLTVEMKRLKTEDPAAFASNHKLGADTLSIIAGEMINGMPQMSARGFQYVDEPPRISIARLDCPGAACPNGISFFFAGETDVAKKTLNEFFREPGIRDPVSDARKLVEAEIQASPEDVGAPITILKVDKNGASWVSNDSGCPIAIAPSI